ncbi:MAG: sigma-70 family RNA polymerase sigma factor [Bacilli bacterium]|nr:sigma-70 family RNA polymerase sigma factor [Bacilli bacterium]
MDLFNDNIDLVKRIVNKMNYGYVAKDDLIQAGLMGLFQAVKNFKESENVKFNTYATYYIIGEIKKELRENRLIKLSKNIYKIIKIIKQNQELSIEDIALKFRLDKNSVIEAYLYMNNITSLDKTDSNNDLRLISIIPYKESKRTHLMDAIESLDAEAKEIIRLRYFKNYTQTELVDVLGKNQSKISRIEKNALQNLRKFLLGK